MRRFLSTALRPRLYPCCQPGGDWYPGTRGGGGGRIRHPVRWLAVSAALTVGVLAAIPGDAHAERASDNYGQVDPVGWTAEGASDSVRARPDSVLPGSVRVADSRPTSRAATPSGMEPGFFNSPTGALLRSVALPGWGQWFNGKKQKAAIYFAAETFLIAKALVWRHRARESGIDFATFDRARGRRNLYYWLTGFAVFISMFDAYGDRYLLYLERTRDAGDDYWGRRGDDGAALFGSAPPAGWRLVLQVRF